LRTIYFDNFKLPIDKGAIEALISRRNAYSHLCETNVKSYAIAGSYRLNAIKSHGLQELYYQTVVDSKCFKLDKDAFDGCDNDLVVSLTSQLGGLPRQIRQPISNDIPNHSAVYYNTVHETSYINDDDKDVSSETNSRRINDGVVKSLAIAIMISLQMVLEYITQMVHLLIILALNLRLFYNQHFIRNNCKWFLVIIQNYSACT
jgi:hypothetical protein